MRMIKYENYDADEQNTTNYQLNVNASQISNICLFRRQTQNPK